MNRLENNVLFYTGTKIIDEEIYVIWISSSDTTFEYQYQLAKIGPGGRLSGPNDPSVCILGCNTC